MLRPSAYFHAGGEAHGRVRAVADTDWRSVSDSVALGKQLLHNQYLGEALR
jgi:hypothetical protein